MGQSVVSVQLRSLGLWEARKCERSDAERMRRLQFSAILRQNVPESGLALTQVRGCVYGGRFRRLLPYVRGILRQACKTSAALGKQVIAAGFVDRSMPSVMEALDQWFLERHPLAFSVLVNAFVRTFNNSIDNISSAKNFIQLNVSTVKNEDGRALKNPFQLRQVTLLPESSMSPYDWEGNRPKKRAEEEEFEEQLPAALRTRFSGYLYVVVSLDETDVVVMHYLPVFRLLNGNNQGLRKKAEMDDLFDMMMTLINDNKTVCGDTSEAGLLPVGIVPAILSVKERELTPVPDSDRERLFARIPDRRRPRLSYEHIFGVYQRM